MRRAKLSSHRLITPRHRSSGGFQLSSFLLAVQLIQHISDRPDLFQFAILDHLVHPSVGSLDTSIDDVVVTRCSRTGFTTKDMGSDGRL